MNQKKYPFYFYLLTFAFPIIFIVLLEMGLRLGGYGQAYPQWIRPSERFSDYIVLNQEITKKYFHTIKARPSPTYDGFFETKKEGTFRVFVLGGSTTAGFPYTINGSFARYIRHFLETVYGEDRIEVINLGISAVNSYTVRDLLPGVIEKQPDLVILYMGHNEYYGALGVGSAENLGTARSLVNLMIALEDYRLTQLIRNLIGGIGNLFSDPPPSRKDETLMARMVGNKLIPYDSDIYQSGLNQLEGNLSDILHMLREAEVPVILSTLTANIRDQQPFESAKEKNLPAAADIFKEGTAAYTRGDSAKAKEMFSRARDLDVLRFRAPAAMNEVIKLVGEQFETAVVWMDEIFDQHSEGGIPGDNLFIDHVHPTLAGYRLMGWAMVEMMRRMGHMPESQKPYSARRIHEMVKQRMTLTALDSIAADLRIRNLKGGWPFLKGTVANMALANYRISNEIDKLAYATVMKKINWEDAHLQAAVWYRDNGQVDNFVKEMQAILENIPLNPQPFKLLIDGLIQYQRIDMAYPYLMQLDARFPGSYSKKWLGTYYLYNQDYQKALGYLIQSQKLNERDAQLLYNLAGAYLYTQNYKKALETIQKCLKLDQNFPGARRMEQDLLRLLKK